MSLTSFAKNIAENIIPVKLIALTCFAVKAAAKTVNNEEDPRFMGVFILTGTFIGMGLIGVGWLMNKKNQCCSANQQKALKPT